MHTAVGGVRPHEVTALQSLAEQAQAIAIPPQYLDPITPSAPEHKQLTGERILAELGLHPRRQAVEAIAQVCDPARDPDPRAGGQADHRRRMPITRSISAPSTAPLTCSWMPPPNSMRNVPGAADAGAGVTSTGTSAVFPRSVCAPSKPCCSNLRHTNTRLALMPWRRAISATDTPGCSASCAIRRRSASGRKRRGIIRRPSVSTETALSVVTVVASICTPRGRKHSCPLRGYRYSRHYLRHTMCPDRTVTTDWQVATYQGFPRRFPSFWRPRGWSCHWLSRHAGSVPPTVVGDGQGSYPSKVRKAGQQ